MRRCYSRCNELTQSIAYASIPPIRTFVADGSFRLHTRGPRMATCSCSCRLWLGPGKSNLGHAAFLELHLADSDTNPVEDPE